MLHSFLYDLCLSFIIRHEIRHIANGHVDYPLDKGNQPMFWENAKNGLSNLDSQTLEMDVDSCVTPGILEGLLRGKAQKEHLPLQLQGDREILASVLFCMDFLFYCMRSAKASCEKDAIQNSHPNASLRHFFCFTTALSYLGEHFPQHVELF